MAWKSGWAKRREITVSDTNIDSNLTHFPLLLTLGTSIGTGSDDVSSIFDELTSDANRKKIAITEDDGTSEIYCEIEKWDDANEEAVLWVSKSDLTLSSSGTTTLYLYYDSTQSDNTTYVGDVGDRTEVWNSDYKGVWHLSDNAANSTVTDSTDNNNDGNYKDSGGNINTSTGNTPGKVGDALDFGGSNDYVSVPDDPVWDFGDKMTASCWFKTSTNQSGKGLVVHDESDYKWLLYLTDDSGRLSFFIRQSSGTTAANAQKETGYYADGNWHHMVGIFDKSLGSNRLKLYVDGNLEKQENAYNEDISAGDEGVSIGRWHENHDLNGKLDDVRIYNEAISNAWIKANYHAQTDNLVSWGSEEEEPTAATTVQAFITG